jgi:methionyl-tRNA formyltransferase
MRLIYLGSGEFGLPTLQRLHEVHEVAAVVTQPDRPAGRGRGLTPTPIGAWAAGAELPLLKVSDANSADVVEKVAGFGADAVVVVAFGQKLSPGLIEALGRLTVNLHASLLPKYRGAAPINWAIINGEAVTGLSVISLAQRMDAGLIYGQAQAPIDPQETAGELHDRLAAMGPDLVCRVLAEFAAGTLQGRPQDDTFATRAPKLSKADGWADFNATAEEVRRRVHGLTPWPGVTVTWRPAGDGAGRPLKLLRVGVLPRSQTGGQAPAPPGTVLDGLAVATGDGAVSLLEVQAPGGRPMAIDAFARGHGLRPGDRLTR